MWVRGKENYSVVIFLFFILHENLSSSFSKHPLPAAFYVINLSFIVTWKQTAYDYDKTLIYLTQFSENPHIFKQTYFFYRYNNVYLFYRSKNVIWRIGS